ncbi:putative GPI mannosyltransferase 2 [Helianthus anomalus]
MGSVPRCTLRLSALKARFFKPRLHPVGSASVYAVFVVATRFLSSSPPIYWFASYVLTSHKGWGYLIWGYSAAYILIGSLLFSNFYPFT